MSDKILENYFQAKDVRLYYVKTKLEDSPILLLHGGISRWEAFETIIPELEKYGCVYALDLRGHGRSDKDIGKYSLTDYVFDVVHFIKEEINSEPPVIFGHSLGGMIGIQIAAYYPELVKGLIIGESPINLEVLRESSKGLAKWKRFSENYSENKEEDRIGEDKIKQGKEENAVMELMIKSVLLTDSDVITAMVDQFENTFMSYDIELLFPMIKCPVLLLQGNPDLQGIIRDEDVKKALRLLSNAKHIKLKNAGHTLLIDDKKATLDAIIPFVKKLLGK
ncbi:alpha/beta hydrolase (plasmid) [Cytobacillus solani]|uniref:alpha/beta fold hydrolase n=1 Tax=Cytobacillus solani TaxID=1637975 RepID=UPI00207A38CD|nr:alpha/beta hydrolase [Cytobacillus solani]USK57894.1 alpha/beta hydrolase [Cytobacillus solani]